MYGGAGSSSRAQAFTESYDPTIDSVDSNMGHGQEEYSSSRAGTRYDNYDPTIEDSIRGEPYLALGEINPVPLRSCALLDSAPIDSASAPKKKGSAWFGKPRSTDDGAYYKEPFVTLATPTHVTFTVIGVTKDASQQILIFFTGHLISNL